MTINCVVDYLVQFDGIQEDLDDKIELLKTYSPFVILTSKNKININNKLTLKFGNLSGRASMK